ncbi:MAG: hypothetical protein ABIA04_07235 [Pseudomonadota bacterium]
MVRLLFDNYTYGFVVHPRRIRDLNKHFPLLKFLPKSLLEKWYEFQVPFRFSKIDGLQSKEGDKIKGISICIPLIPTKMKRNETLAQKKIVDAIKMMDKLGVQIVGLGAFTSIVTNDGKTIADKVNPFVTTGNAFSVAAACQNIISLSENTGINYKEKIMSIVGAAGSVGSGCVWFFSDKVKQLRLIDINEKELNNLEDKIKIEKPESNVAKCTIKDVKTSDLVIVATNAAGTILDIDNFKKGALVVDCAQPRNVSSLISNDRPDVIVVDSAYIQIPDLNFGYDIGNINPNEVPGCLGEVMLLSKYNYKNINDITMKCIGKPELKQFLETIDMAEESGFKLAYYRNASGYVDEKQLNNIKDLNKAK